MHRACSFQAGPHDLTDKRYKEPRKVRNDPDIVVKLGTEPIIAFSLAKDKCIQLDRDTHSFW